jgi:hypothetical protein
MRRSSEAIHTKESGGERISRTLRNLNIVGAVALSGAGIVIGSALLAGLGAINAGQAGFFEATRQWSKQRNKNHRSDDRKNNYH